MIFIMDKRKKEKRVYGHILSKNKYMNESLVTIFGIGLKTSNKISKLFGYSKFLKVKDLSNNNIQSLIDNLEKYDTFIEREKKKRKIKTLKYYESNKSIKGFRLKYGLPVRGQRTKSNAKTVKRGKIIKSKKKSKKKRLKK